MGKRTRHGARLGGQVLALHQRGRKLRVGQRLLLQRGAQRRLQVRLLRRQRRLALERRVPGALQAHRPAVRQSGSDCPEPLLLSTSCRFRDHCTSTNEIAEPNEGRCRQGCGARAEAESCTGTHLQIGHQDWGRPAGRRARPATTLWSCSARPQPPAGAHWPPPARPPARPARRPAPRTAPATAPPPATPQLSPPRPPSHAPALPCTPCTAARQIIVNRVPPSSLR